MDVRLISLDTIDATRILLNLITLGLLFWRTIDLGNPLLTEAFRLYYHLFHGQTFKDIYIIYLIHMSRPFEIFLLCTTHSRIALNVALYVNARYQIRI